MDVFRDISFTVEHGQFVSIIGPSGCGKTTILKIISGLEKASEGEIYIDDNHLTGPDKMVGLVFQEYALFPWRTTLQNVEFGLEIKGMEKRRRKSAAGDYIKAFGLDGFEDKYPFELSGGMQQRVAIARTLINDPAVLLMDEPFSSLDGPTRNSLQDFLLKIWQERKVTILFVTHSVEEAVYLSDRVIVLSGRPAKIVKIIDLDYPRPRGRTAIRSSPAAKEIFDLLTDETIPVHM